MMVGAWKNQRAMDADILPLTDATMSLECLAKAPSQVILPGDGKPVKSEFKDGKLLFYLPVSRRTKLPDVVALDF